MSILVSGNMCLAFGGGGGGGGVLHKLLSYIEGVFTEASCRQWISLSKVLDASPCCDWRDQIYWSHNSRKIATFCPCV